VLGWISALLWTIVEAPAKPTVEQQWVEAMAAMHSGRLVLDDEETIPQQKYTLWMIWNRYSPRNRAAVL
jgi:hypothetical protein